jgi:4-hydroxybenzoate polyprenyltransferase
MATPKGPIIWAGPAEAPGSTAGRWPPARFLDERDPYGGRAKAALFLLHPGPSVLVTMVTIAAAGLAVQRVPPLDVAIRLLLVMLPAQFAIGATNDLFDRPADGAAKPYKPLVRGVVSARFAIALTAIGIVISLAAAASLGRLALIVTVAGLSAGLAYDAGAKRSAWSWLTWWAGIAAVPVGAYAAVGRTPGALWWLVPLAGFLAIGLHFANALPDLEGDAAAGIRSLPVRLGRRGTVMAAAAAPVLAAVAILALRAPLGQDGPPVFAAAGALCGCTAAAIALTRTDATAGARTLFPIFALGFAAAAVAWMAALPR